MEPYETASVAQITTATDQFSKPPSPNGGVVGEEPQSQLVSNFTQPQEHAAGGEETNPENATISEIPADSRQVVSLSTPAQTDASASLPGAPVTSCESTEPQFGIRKTDMAPDHAVVRLIERADRSAGRLVNLLALHFPLSFRDEARFDGRTVKLLKRAQIFVADLWAALNTRGLGEFHDIDHLTMFPGKSICAQHGIICMRRRSGVYLYGRGCSEADVLSSCRLSRCADVA